MNTTPKEISTVDPAGAVTPAGDDMHQAAAAASIMLDEALFERAKFVAKYMSQADGFTPKHLVGKVQSCFAVVVLALNWKLEPYQVARCTYETPGGAVGYEGKLIQAILEQSGRIARGGVRYEHYGDWSRVQGKYKIATSGKGNKFPVSDWKEEDETGLGVTVKVLLKGEDVDRTLDFDLRDAFPRNSTLWATRPKQQICYTAVRAFANVVVPHLIMGVPWDSDDDSGFEGSGMRNVTPAKEGRTALPLRSEYKEPEAARASVFLLLDENGEVDQEFTSAAAFTDALIELLEDPSSDPYVVVDSNDEEIERLKANHEEGCHRPLMTAFRKRVEAETPDAPMDEAGEVEPTQQGGPGAEEEGAGIVEGERVDTPDGGDEGTAEAQEAAPEPEPEPEPKYMVPTIKIIETTAGLDYAKFAADMTEEINAITNPAHVAALMSHYQKDIDAAANAGKKASSNRIKRAAEERLQTIST